MSTKGNDHQASGFAGIFKKQPKKQQKWLLAAVECWFLIGSAGISNQICPNKIVLLACQVLCKQHHYWFCCNRNNASTASNTDCCINAAVALQELNGFQICLQIQKCAIKSIEIGYKYVPFCSVFRFPFLQLRMMAAGGWCCISSASEYISILFSDS